MNARKALIAAFREHRPDAGIYQFEAASARFWGKSLNLPAVRNRHEFQLRSGLHPEPKLQEAWNRDPSSVVYSVITELSVPVDRTDEQRRDDLEALWELTLEGRSEFDASVVLLKH